MYILERLNYEGTIKMNLNFQEKKIVCVSYFGFCAAVLTWKKDLYALFASKSRKDWIL